MLMKHTGLITIFLMLVASLSSCGPPTPILIGLAVELTGKQADVGINIRDAALLAVNDINQQGGVLGHPLKLLIRDDQGNPDIARQVDDTLVQDGALAIIGHYTSGQTAAVFAQMNLAGKVLISPSASSTDFTGKADYFFRLTPDNDFITRALADYIYETRGVRHLAGVYDLNNLSYSSTFWGLIRYQFEKRGGKISTVIPFKSGETDLSDLVQKIKTSGADGFLIVASAVDTAMISQYARQAGLDVPRFAASWAQTDQLLEKGGRAVEGLVLCTTNNPNDTSAPYLKFVKQFNDKYGRSPFFATTQAYETVLVLAHALEQTGGMEQGLPAALSTIKNFQGVQGTISFDEFGDVSRAVYIIQVKGGRFVTLKTIPPSAR